VVGDGIPGPSPRDLGDFIGSADAALRLRERRLLRPALWTLERLVAAARARAERETHDLRFDVCCREKGWLDPMGFLDRRETDVDDAWAHRSGARLVLCAARRRG
jgi:hypothetical protein